MEEQRPGLVYYASGFRTPPPIIKAGGYTSPYGVMEHNARSRLETIAIQIARHAEQNYRC
jgi:hypothetical protein